MSTSLQRVNDKKKITFFLRPDINKYLVDKNEIREYPKRTWFKGSR